MRFLKAAYLNLPWMKINPPVFPLIFLSHLRNTLKILCFYNCNVCLPEVSQRLPETWKLSASCWASRTLNRESEARCDSTRPARRNRYWSLHWLCWMLMVWEEPSMLEIPNVGQATLRCRTMIYLLPSLLPLCFQGPCPGLGAECTFGPHGLLQSAASMAEPSQFSIACPPAPCRGEGRALPKKDSKREIANASRGHGGDSKGSSVKEGGNSHPVPPRDDISANNTDGLTLTWNSS